MVPPELRFRFSSVNMDCTNLFSVPDYFNTNSRLNVEKNLESKVQIPESSFSFRLCYSSPKWNEIVFNIAGIIFPNLKLSIVNLMHVS